MCFCLFYINLFIFTKFMLINSANITNTLHNNTEYLKFKDFFIRNFFLNSHKTHYNTKFLSKLVKNKKLFRKMRNNFFNLI